MKTVILTSLFTCLGLVLTSAFLVGPQWLLMGLFYIPMNLGVPIVIIISIFHLLVYKVLKTNNLAMYYLVFGALCFIFFIIMFFVDYLYFNSHRTLKENFEIDYKGWVYNFGLIGIAITPLIYKLVKRKMTPNNNYR